MSLFAGPDYSHIIWKPEQYPQGESGISGFMAGLGSGMQAGGDYKKAKKDYVKQSWVDPTGERPAKPNPFQFYTGTAPQQQGDLHSIIDQIINAVRGF